MNRIDSEPINVPDQLCVFLAHEAGAPFNRIPPIH